jgi:hypothetical protein
MVLSGKARRSLATKLSSVEELVGADIAIVSRL